MKNAMEYFQQNAIWNGSRVMNVIQLMIGYAKQCHQSHLSPIKDEAKVIEGYLSRYCKEFGGRIFINQSIQGGYYIGVYDNNGDLLKGTSGATIENCINLLKNK